MACISPAEHVAARRHRHHFHLTLTILAPVECPTTCQSSTACSSGIGMWSWAWKRIAVSNSLGFSISGKRSVRTATRWLASPSRTVFESLCLENSSLQRVAQRLGVGHLALVEDSGAKGGDAELGDRRVAVDPSSIAAMLPASTSRPTIALFLFVESMLASAQGSGGPPRALDRPKQAIP